MTADRTPTDAPCAICNGRPAFTMRDAPTPCCDPCRKAAGDLLAAMGRLILREAATLEAKEAAAA